MWLSAGGLTVVVAARSVPSVLPWRDPNISETSGANFLMRPPIDEPSAAPDGDPASPSGCGDGVLTTPASGCVSTVRRASARRSGEASRLTDWRRRRETEGRMPHLRQERRRRVAANRLLAAGGGAVGEGVELEDVAGEGLVR